MARVADDQIAEFKNAFAQFETGSDGVTFHELRLIVTSLGYAPSDIALKTMITEAGSNPDQSKMISKQAYLKMMEKYISDAPTEGDLFHAFKHLDKDGDGLIPVEDLTRFLTTLGEELTHDEARELASAGDNNMQGKIEYAQFVKILTAPWSGDQISLQLVEHVTIACSTLKTSQQDVTCLFVLSL